MKRFIILGAINACLSVALGAFGAHALKASLDEYSLGIWNTGVQYQMYHALGLLVVGLLASKFPTSKLISTAGWLMFVGIVLFAGSLFVLALSGITILGAITPFGGVAMVIAWILIVVAAVKHM